MNILEFYSVAVEGIWLVVQPVSHSLSQSPIRATGPPELFLPFAMSQKRDEMLIAWE